jgi:hypothetical protein
MSENNDVVQGVLKLIGSTDGQCWTNMDDFIRWFVSNVGVEIGTEITNIKVSSSAPTDAQRNYLWFRMSNSGSFIGIYLWGAGTWNLVWPLVGQIIRMYGRSDQPPSGFAVADTSAAGLPTAVVAMLQASWVLNSGGTYWDLFDVVFVGF